MNNNTMMNNTNEEVKVCSVCGEPITDGMDTYEDAHGNIICTDCMDDGFICDICGEYHPYDDAAQLMGRLSRDYTNICTDCADEMGNVYKCHDCERYGYRRDFAFIDEGGRIEAICDDCSDSWRQCYDCGSIIPQEDAYWDENSEEYYCSSCYEEHRTGINNCGYKPDPDFHCTFADKEFDRWNRGRSDLYMGMELEVDDGYHCATYAQKVTEEAGDFIYCKEDGSLGTESFEMVSHPATLNWWKENEGMLDRIIGICKEGGFKSHDAGTCGLHIHVNRAYLGDGESSKEEATIAKIILLVTKHWGNMVKFSRRNNDELNHWAKKSSMLLAESESEILQTIKNTDRGNNDRYHAVNLTNYATVEFRIFRGSLVKETILATLELVSNLCNFAKDKTVRECLEAEWNDFAHYVDYPEIKSYCQRRGIVSDKGGELEKYIPIVPKFCEGELVKITGRQYHIPYGLEWATGLNAVVTSVRADDWNRTCYYTLDWENEAKAMEQYKNKQENNWRTYRNFDITSYTSISEDVLTSLAEFDQE